MEDMRLLNAARSVLMTGIAQIRPGVRTQVVTTAMEKQAKKLGFATVLTLCGHGIGKTMHEPPNIYNGTPQSLSLEVQKNYWYTFKAGDIVCIEPQITYEDRLGKTLDDGWTIATRDGEKAAFFEHVVEVTKKGHRILTSHI